MSDFSPFRKSGSWISGLSGPLMTSQNGHRAIGFEADCFSLFRNHVAVRKKPAYTSFKHSMVTLGFWTCTAMACGHFYVQP